MKTGELRGRWADGFSLLPGAWPPSPPPHPPPPHPHPHPTPPPPPQEIDRLLSGGGLERHASDPWAFAPAGAAAALPGFNAFAEGGEPGGDQAGGASFPAVASPAAGSAASTPRFGARAGSGDWAAARGASPRASDAAEGGGGGGGARVIGTGTVLHTFVGDYNQPEELSVFEGDKVGGRVGQLRVRGGLPWAQKSRAGLELPACPPAQAWALSRPAGALGHVHFSSRCCSSPHLAPPRPLAPRPQVEVLEEADGWMLVRDPGGREGLVPTSYLQLDALYQQVGRGRMAGCCDGCVRARCPSYPAFYCGKSMEQPRVHLGCCPARAGLWRVPLRHTHHPLPLRTRRCAQQNLQSAAAAEAAAAAAEYQRQASGTPTRAHRRGASVDYGAAQQSKEDLLDNIFSSYTGAVTGCVLLVAEGTGLQGATRTSRTSPPPRVSGWMAVEGLASGLIGASGRVEGCKEDLLDSIFSSYPGEGRCTSTPAERRPQPLAPAPVHRVRRTPRRNCLRNCLTRVSLRCSAHPPTRHGAANPAMPTMPEEAPFGEPYSFGAPSPSASASASFGGGASVSYGGAEPSTAATEYSTGYHSGGRAGGGGGGGGTGGSLSPVARQDSFTAGTGRTGASRLPPACGGCAC